jgi:CheY-like chemotaxis protein
MQQILLVDDDDLFRKMLMLKLTKMGYAVMEARDGNEALILHSHLSPDVILTDLIMPNKEGLETIAELRRLYPAARIIAMSGGGRGSATDYLKIALLMGADRVLAKPFSDDELSLALDDLLGEGRKPDNSPLAVT